MIRKPIIGKKVITGDPACCDSGFEKGTKVVINHLCYDNYSIIVKDLNGHWAYHCKKCLSPLKRI
jgi:hypothetical protein